MLNWVIPGQEVRERKATPEYPILSSEVSTNNGYLKMIETTFISLKNLKTTKISVVMKYMLTA
jgi:hypothetical protein